MSSFWLKLKQQWTIEEISIFSNSSHLEWRVELSDTILKGTHPGTIPARLGFNLVQRFQRRRFKCESLRCTMDGRRTPSDGKSSHGLWPGELKTKKMSNTDPTGWSQVLEKIKQFLLLTRVKYHQLERTVQKGSFN
jgi:hypothetical protein